MRTSRSGKSGIKIAVGLCAVVIGGLILIFTLRSGTENISSSGQTANIADSLPGNTASNSQASPTSPIPSKALLNDNGYYAAQTFNNCGPAALSMDLSFYGVHVGQAELADILRPTHNMTGKGDDKSTPPDEIAAQAEAYGLVAYFRPTGISTF